jgi:hypothetical protein
MNKEQEIKEIREQLNEITNSHFVKRTLEAVKKIVDIGDKLRKIENEKDK